MTKEKLPSVKTPTANEIAKKHKVSLTYISKQLAQGIKVEKEHTRDKKTASEIARDHLGERPDYYERLKKVEGNKKLGEDATTFSGTAGVTGLGYIGGDVLAVDAADDPDPAADYRGTNMMSYRDSNGDLMRFIRKIHGLYHSKLGFKLYDPTKIAQHKNFPVNKLDETTINELGDLVKDGMPGYEEISTLRNTRKNDEKVRYGLQELSRKLLTRYYEKAMKTPFSRQNDITRNPKSNKVMNRLKGVTLAAKKGANTGPLWKERQDDKPTKTLKQILRKPVKRKKMAPTREKTGFGRERLVKAMDKLRDKAWQQSYTPRLATKQMREPDMFWQGPKYPGDEGVEKAISAQGRTQGKLERVVSRLNQYGDKPGMKVHTKYLPTSEVSKNKSWGHRKEEREMDTRELVSEAIINIINEDYVTMKENFEKVLQEKQMEKLEERKKEIAAAFFE